MIEKLRTRTNINKVIALSISWQRENLLARGLGLEHLRDLLLRAWQGQFCVQEHH